jgi:hypothetical protein
MATFRGKSCGWRERSFLTPDGLHWTFNWVRRNLNLNINTGPKLLNVKNREWGLWCGRMSVGAELWGGYWSRAYRTRQPRPWLRRSCNTSRSLDKWNVRRYFGRCRHSSKAWTKNVDLSFAPQLDGNISTYWRAWRLQLRWLNCVNHV